ncbi:MAG: type II CAAX endopeptidase family protein [Gemmatimonadaceae bacterium]
MTVRAIWYAPGGRIRASWRLILFVALFVAVTFFVVGVLRRVAAADAMRQDVLAWVTLGAVVAAQFVMMRLVERRPWSFVGLDAGAARPLLLAKGLVIGALGIALPSLLLYAMHWLTVVPEPPGLGALRFGLEMALFLLPAALFEELLVRGYPFAVLSETLGWKWALGITSVVFGLLHTTNPNVTAEPIALVMLAGIFLGAVLVVTRSLYCAWMAHFAWNFVMAAFMHTAVSGFMNVPPSYETIETGPDWATGGAWGPEGGAFAGGAMLLFTVLLLRRRNRPTSIPTSPDSPVR